MLKEQKRGHYDWHEINRGRTNKDEISQLTDYVKQKT